NRGLLDASHFLFNLVLRLYEQAKGLQKNQIQIKCLDAMDALLRGEWISPSEFSAHEDIL
ncbi:unnamed protein product, partial [marine sediment metagenome]